MIYSGCFPKFGIQAKIEVVQLFTFHSENVSRVILQMFHGLKAPAIFPDVLGG